MIDFDLVQVHENKTKRYAEVVIRDKNSYSVYAGNLMLVDNPRAYYPPDYSPDSVKYKRVAVIDGTGETATVDLYLADKDGEMISDLPWPKDWPVQVAPDFLRKHDFEVVMA